MALTKMYLYLARRDKKGIRLLTSFMGEPQSGRIDVNTVGLPPEILEPIISEVYENRMMWEPWIQPAESFNQLKSMLVEKGFTNLPMSSNPVVKQIKGQSATVSQPTLDKKSMLQKKGT